MSAVSRRLAKAILNGFDAFFAEFQNVTLGAQARFESADWQAVQHASRRRLEIYKETIRKVAEDADTITQHRLADRDIWAEAKNEFANLVLDNNNFEICQTFFNSVYCYVFKHERVREMHAFVMQQQEVPETIDEQSILKRYTYKGDLEATCKQILLGADFVIRWEDLNRDCRRIAEVVEQRLVSLDDLDGPFQVEVLENLFYRNKGAYLVGRIYDEQMSVPFVLPILHNELTGDEAGIYVDTVIYTPRDISVLFSFTQSWFMVDSTIPSEYVQFLKKLMPHKEIFELYMTIGFGKHGKTEFVRRATEVTRSLDTPYIIAPGIKGMVMLVFTLEGFDYVYKVIKDRFTPPKSMTRQHVKDCYLLVKRWERSGRMADTQEFTNLAFDLRRFSPELLAEMEKEIPSLMEIHSITLVLKHVYVERKMIPLNLYLKNANAEEVENVMDEYGNAIKQLAAANIFPGDMLLKNFGVTRHGRVVFYDYDEIVPLTECNFRKIPEPKTEEQEMASQPWYPVADNDIFPEEFRLFFTGNREAKDVFDRLHSELYEASFWQALQEQIRAGVVADVFPYRRAIRFENRTGNAIGELLQGTVAGNEQT